MDIRPLPPTLLRWRVPDGVLDFRTTADVPPTEAVIGQSSALAGLARGVSMRSPGFNVFVVGLRSAGRLGLVRRIVESLRPPKRTSRDFVYVANFREPARPKLLQFPPGRGAAFRRDMVRVASVLLEEIPRLVRSDEVRGLRDRHTNVAAAAHHGALMRLKAKAREMGFLIGEVDSDEVVLLYVDPEEEMPEEGEEEDAKVHTRAEVQVLAESGAIRLPVPLEELLARFDQLERDLAEVRDASEDAILETVRAVGDAEQEAVRKGTARLFAELCRRWPVASNWLRDLQNFVVESPEIWNEEEGDQAGFVAAFTVNLVHVGKRSGKAPVVVVPNPTWPNLFGGIEGEPGASDHRSIRSGSLLDADGGFLVLSASDLLQEPTTWKVLKRALMFGEAEVQNPEMPAFGGGLSVMRPDPVQLDVKIILVGDIDTYAALFYGDPDFSGIFKIKAEFEPDATITPELLREYAAFCARMVRRERLSHLTRDGVEAVLEWAVREAGRGGRISTHFGTVADLVREAAVESAGEIIDRTHVEAALAARRQRDDFGERRVLEMMGSGAIRMAVTGEAVGQVNALVVYHVGGHDFGRPMRVTVTAGVGKGGAVSIERDARLSGRTHDKGVRILGGFLRHRFGDTRRLCFTAAIAFEQSYGRVEGDSATVPELLAILSAISGLPVRQEVAITGSLDQFGAIQAVGGVNDKIEGYWRACRLLGETGTQGVVIPKANVQDLSLSAEVQRACAEERFRVWGLDHLDEAVALLFGRPAEDVMAAAAARLDAWARISGSPRA
ncbi:MAG: AAA family ATPase [Myxococcota bacterium]